MKSRVPNRVPKGSGAVSAPSFRTRTSIALIEPRIVGTRARRGQFWGSIAEEWTGARGAASARSAMPERVPPTNAGHFARGAALGLLAALPAALVFRGFTVDDALIIARVASNLASGVGHRMNPGGPEVDAVTPLGYAHLLSLGGAAGTLEMLARSRALGLSAWLAGAAVLGGLLPRRP